MALNGYFYFSDQLTITLVFDTWLLAARHYNSNP